MGKYDRELYLWYKDRGICIQCRRERAAPGKVRCEECLAVEADRTYENRQKMPVEQRKEVNRRNNAKRIELRRTRAKNGLCASCGKPYPEATTFGQCRECRNKRNRKKLEAKMEHGYIPRSERPTYGMCYRCGSPIDEGKLCESCIEQNKRASQMGPWRDFVKAEIDRCFR